MASLGMSTVYAFLKSKNQTHYLHVPLKKSCCEIPCLFICLYLRRHDIKNMICSSNTSGEHIGKKYCNDIKCIPTH